MSNYFVKGIFDLSLNIFQPLGGNTNILSYNTGYTSNGVDLRNIFLPYFLSKAESTGYLVNNIDLCDIFQKKFPFNIGDGVTYVAGGYNTQYPVAVDPTHSLIYITDGSGSFQITDTSKMVAIVLVGGGGGGSGSSNSQTSSPGRGGQRVDITRDFTNIPTTIGVGGGGPAIPSTAGGYTFVGATRALGGGDSSSGSVAGQIGAGSLVSYNGMYYGGGGGGQYGSGLGSGGYIGGGGGGGGNGPNSNSNGEDLSGNNGGKGGAQILNDPSGDGGIGDFGVNGGAGGIGNFGAGGGGGASGAAKRITTTTGNVFSGGVGGNNSGGGGGGVGLTGRSYTIETFGYDSKGYLGGPGGGGAGGKNSGGGGGAPGKMEYYSSGNYIRSYAQGGKGGSGIIILVYK